MPYFDEPDAPEEAVREMLKVGAVIAGPQIEHKPGQRFMMGAQPMVIVGEITKAEFVEKGLAAGIPGWRMLSLPEDARYWAITSD